MATRIKPSKKLTLKDLLSRLSPLRAQKLLGDDGVRLLRAGGRYEVQLEHVVLARDECRVRVPLVPPESGEVLVRLIRTGAGRGRLQGDCSRCTGPCEHVGAALSVILEEKTPLGLADVPPDDAPLELLTEEQLVARAIAERAERAKVERFRLKSSDPSRPWTDYTLTSAASGRTYQLALRGEERGQSYCSCPDFRTNTLGTCKHLLYALERVRARFPEKLRRRPYRHRDVQIYLEYGQEVTLRAAVPERLAAEAARIVEPLAGRPIDDVHDLLRRLSRLERLGAPATIYPDAEELIQQRLFRDRMAQLVADIRRDPENHPLRRELLKTELLPYQLDGIAFAIGAGRAVLADDMGLGKTIQAVGVAELLAREMGIRRVLVICPASLKSQWRSEIARFCDRDYQLVMGSAAERSEQYPEEAFYTICNYEQVLRDIVSIESVRWDLIVLDEGQRIKNWESKTSAIIKRLRSQFALVLSGTPLENRLDELYSVVQFIDDRRLAPAFRFFHRHRVVGDDGRVIGYKNLDELRRNLEPVLLRRTRASVLQQLPPRMSEIVRIPPTEQQKDVHDGNMKTAAQIAAKKYLTEMDLLRLQRALLLARMSANSTFLVDKQPPGYSSKLDRLADLFDQLWAERDRKTVLFSEWTTMLDLIEPLLDQRNVEYVRLDGSVPQRKRQDLVKRFQHDERCRAFLTTNAGSTGLNLQAANTVVNVDLPWNPAVLEQRIARAHRMGQQRPVQVFLLVTEETIEENMLQVLTLKHDLALAALDPDSDVTELAASGGINDLKRRLEVLLGARGEAPVDAAGRQRVESEAERLAAHRERVAAAGGELLGAVFQFVGELVGNGQQAAPSEAMVDQLRSRLSDCVQDAPDGRPQLTVTLPDRQALDNLAGTLARLLVRE